MQNLRINDNQNDNESQNNTWFIIWLLSVGTHKLIQLQLQLQYNYYSIQLRLVMSIWCLLVIKIICCHAHLYKTQLSFRGHLHNFQCASQPFLYLGVPPGNSHWGKELLSRYPISIALFPGSAESMAGYMWWYNTVQEIFYLFTW